MPLVQHDDAIGSPRQLGCQVAAHRQALLLDTASGLLLPAAAAQAPTLPSLPADKLVPGCYALVVKGLPTDDVQDLLARRRR